MNAQHTPGPWSCTPRFQDKVDVIHAEPAKPGAASLTVARVTVRDSWREEQEANARLIAAAPDLLEVAEMVLGMATVDMPQVLIDAAGIAAAKARGRAS